MIKHFSLMVATIWLPACAFAHCDTLDGPVVAVQQFDYLILAKSDLPQPLHGLR
jgi:hypothetical protein